MSRKKNTLKSGIALLLAVCSTNTTASPPQRATIFKGDAAAKLLSQCSRPTPDVGNGFYGPTSAQIKSLDQAVAAHSKANDIKDADTLASLQDKYAVEATGIIRSSRRYVYGSYYPMIMQDGAKHASSMPFIVCDGGNRFFGAEIDIATGKITHFAKNGR